MAVKSKLQLSWAFLKTTLQAFSNDGCTTLAAALAFYAVFSIPPLVLIVMTVTGWLWNEDVVRQHVERQLGDLMGGVGKEQLLDMMDHVQRFRRGSWSTAMHSGVLLVASTGLMSELQLALNRVWGVKPGETQGGVKQIVLKRILSFGMVMVIALLLLISMILSAVLSAAIYYLKDMLPGESGGTLSWAGQTSLMGLLVTLLFAMLFKWLPDAKVPWRDVWVGAAVTGVLFLVGKEVLGWYLGRVNPDAYGAAGALVLFLMWVNYTMMILLFGAEFTEVWSTFRTDRHLPGLEAVTNSPGKGASTPAASSGW